MNYTELTTRIEEKMENSFTADQHALFARQAEYKIYNSINSLAQKRNQTAALTVGNSYLSMPSDWLSTNSLAVVDGSGAHNYLLRKDVSFIREAYPDPTAQAIPQYYAEYDEDTFILGPTPDSAYTVQLHYLRYPESIVTATNTWVGDNLENLLYAAVTVQAGIFLKVEEDMMKEYRDDYKQALMEAKQLVDGRQEQEAYRAGFPKVPTV